jgi:hypothetical protein
MHDRVGTKGTGPSEFCLPKSNVQRRITNRHVNVTSKASAYKKQTGVPTMRSLYSLLQLLAAMSGAVAPPTKKAGVDRFTLDDDRPFDSYIAKYEAEMKRNNDAALFGEQGAAKSDKKTTPKRKKSRVSKQINATLFLLTIL